MEYICPNCEEEFEFEEELELGDFIDCPDCDAELEVAQDDKGNLVLIEDEDDNEEVDNEDIDDSIFDKM